MDPIDKIASSSIPEQPESGVAGASFVTTALAAAALGGALFLDAAIETFLAGSAVRWWVGAAAALYLVATAATLKMRVGWQGRLVAALLALLGVVAATAWLPDGLTAGLRILGQPTPTVLAVLVAGGVVLAGVALASTPRLPLAARIGIAVVAGYAAIAFLAAAVRGTPLPALFAGQSVWQRLPVALQGAFVGGLIVLPLGFVWAVVRAGLRRPPEMSMRSEVWKLTAMAVSFAIVVAGIPMRSSVPGGVAASQAAASTESLAARLGIDPNAPKLSPVALNAALANSLRAIEDGERDSPRDHWDPAYVASALEFDPPRMFAWVQANTFWVPYRGLLRGPVGVLMDRLGNSLDRAALLGVLLRAAGKEVRFVRGTLSREQAEEVMVGLLGGRYARRPPSEEIRAIDGTAAAQYQLDENSVRRTVAAQADFSARKRTELLERVPDQVQRLMAAVGPPARPPASAAVERAIEILQDHWWVQALEDGEWRDFDLLSSSPGSAGPNPSQTWNLKELPDEFRHQVTVRVIAEQWNNGSLTERPALEASFRPADLLGQPVTLQIFASKWPATFPPTGLTVAQGLKQVALDQHEWTPTILLGAEPVTQLAIRDTGEVAPPRSAAEEFGGALGNKIGGLGKALDDALGPSTQPPEPKPTVTSALTATWIEYAIDQPGQPTRKIRRELFDLIGPAARASRSVVLPHLDDTVRFARSLALIRETEVLPVVSRFRPEYVLHLGAQSLLANREILGSLLRGEVSDDFAHAEEVASRLVPLPTSLYGLAVARFEWSRFADNIFVDTTNVLTRHTLFEPAANGFRLRVATDIVTNDIGVDVMAHDPFAIRVEQGVLDTNAEAILGSSHPDAANAGWAYRGLSDKWTTFRRAGDPQLNAIRLPSDVRKRIADDLAAGYVVVAPTAPVTIGSSAFAGWWRINPETGASLGMGSNGWGASGPMVDFLIGFVVGGYMALLLSLTWCYSGLGFNPQWARDSRETGRRPLVDRLVIPVEAAGNECFVLAWTDALIGAITGGFLGLRAGLGGGGKPGSSKPGGPGDGKPGGSAGGSGPEGGGGPGGPGGAPPGSGPKGGPNQPGGPGSRPSPSDPSLDAKWKQLQQNLQEASNNWEQNKYGPDALKYFNQLRQALRDVAQFKDPDHPYWKVPFEPDTRLPWPYGPDPTFPGRPVTGPPTGPGGTQVIPPPSTGGNPPPTGPGGTQIIPGRDGALPSAPSQPGTGPGGTQVIPPGPTSPTLPQINCAGTPCVSPYEKTQTGLGGVLNTLGQKSGG